MRRLRENAGSTGAVDVGADASDASDASVISRAAKTLTLRHLCSRQMLLQLISWAAAAQLSAQLARSGAEPAAARRCWSLYALLKVVEGQVSHGAHIAPRLLNRVPPAGGQHERRISASAAPDCERGDDAASRPPPAAAGAARNLLQGSAGTLQARLPTTRRSRQVGCADGAAAARHFLWWLRRCSATGSE